ncbi:MAG: zinc-finger-containing protein [Candidatus Sulfotelmatobacter sp.]
MRPGPICPYCGSRAILCDAMAVYGPAYEGRFNLWVCQNYPQCDSYVGVHANSPYAAPMGSLANPALRKLRKQAGEAFAELWRSGRMTRSQASRKLEKIMGHRKYHSHIAGYNEDQCLRALMALGEPVQERTNA